KLWETARIRYWPRNFSIELPRDCESEHQFCRTMLAEKCFFCQSEENPPFILACQMCQITHARVLNPYYGIDDNSSED
ncbi:2627_t:CDS:2, partial [Paraglomus occultum]